MVLLIPGSFPILKRLNHAAQRWTARGQRGRPTLGSAEGTDHSQELGCIREDELLAGDLDYQEFKRLPRKDEAVVLTRRWLCGSL